MNYKLEKFWNKQETMLTLRKETMNYKLEKFWNKNITEYIINIDDEL